MQLEEPRGGRGRHVSAFLRQDRGQPQGLALTLGRIHIHVTAARVEDHEPDQSGSDHEPDDEQPPVELGIHRREYRERERFEPTLPSPLHFPGC
jgi:hypothetical protein